MNKTWIWAYNPAGRLVEVDGDQWPTLEKNGFKKADVPVTPTTSVVPGNKADLNFVSLFWASNGMGRVGEEVLLSLDRLGIKVKVLPDFIERKDLQERTLELVDISEGYEKADTTLYYAIPKILPRDSSTRNFLHMDWDTTIAPDIWVKNINKYIDKVYPSSTFVEETFSNSGVKVPMTVIRHGVRADRFPLLEREKSWEFVFLTCGDISMRKGTDVLVEAFLEAFPVERNVKLIIKSNKELEWGKIKKPTDKRIEVITERYAHENFLKLYEQADCYVAPSRAEGFCLPAVEAMATGLPVIIHNWSGMASIANENYNFPIGSGEFMKAEPWHYPEEYQDGKGIGDWKSPNKKELIEKLKYVYRNQDKAREIGRKASKWAREEWDWDKQVRKMWIDMAETSMPRPQESSTKQKGWGEFYQQAKITKESVQAYANAHKELFWILKGFYPKKVIESGCGPASMSAFLSLPEQRIEEVRINKHKFEEIVAIDNDEKVLEVARKNLKQFGEVRLTNADAFVYSENADVVFSQGVLEHLTDNDMRLLVENQLKQAPLVIHSVPNNDYNQIDFGNERLLNDFQFYQIFDGLDLTIYRYWNEEGKKRMSALVFKNLKEKPLTSIIMPVFNHKDLTIKAIEAVRKNTKDYELIVIDNHSTDGISEWLDNQPDIKVVHCSQNLGVPGAKNLGIALAKGEYVCFLDNDTEAGEGWLENLLSVFEDKTVGFTGTDGYWIDTKNKEFRGTQFTNQKEVDWAAHSIFVFPRRLIKETGLLIDRDLWCIEDVDQCCRIRNLGYKGLLPPVETNIKHLGGQTAKEMIKTTPKYNQFADRIWQDWGEFINSRTLSSRIDIGSGDNPRQGYVHVDIQQIPHVDIIAKANELNLPDNSVGEIYSSHLIEHFTQNQLDIVLHEWHRVLKDGGYLVLKCPDILKVCEKLLNGKVDYDLGVAWIYGGQRTEFDFHYWSYSFDTLKKKLEKSGFVGIEKLSDPDDWLKVMAVCKKDKDEKKKESLRVLFKGNHYHIFGGGENMTFGVIKILSELYNNLEVDIDLTKLDIKKAFDINLGELTKRSNRQNDLFMCISHFSLPKPEGKQNIAVVFYPQFDWSREIKGYDKVVTISKYSADAIKEKWGIDSVIIPPAVDISKFKVEEKKNQIISVGRFFWREAGNNKNQHVLIKAFSQMPEGWKLVLVGSVQDNAYFESLKKMAKGLNVEFVHDTPFDELVRLYSESKVYWSATGYGTIVPSSQEHFGIVAVEALASGCRTLVFNGGGMAEINGVEKWNTIEELVTMTLKEKVNIESLVAGVEGYSFENVKKQWQNLIGDLWKKK